MILPQRRTSEINMILGGMQFWILKRRSCKNKKTQDIRFLALVWLILFCSFVSISCTSLFPTRKTLGNSTVESADRTKLLKPMIEGASPSVASSSEASGNAQQDTPSKTQGAKTSLNAWNTVLSRLGLGRSLNKAVADGDQLVKPKIKDGIEDQAALEPNIRHRGADKVAGAARESSREARNSLSADILSKDDSQTDKQRPMTDRRSSVDDEKSKAKATPGAGKGDPSKSSTDKTAGTDQVTAKISGESETDEPPGSFQKHDHAKYTSVIRNKAIDKLNQEKTCDFARVCRDSYTDEWSLTLYFKKNQTYHYVTYSWDEIDGKWDESFVSDKRPLSGWKHHISFSSAGKTCKVLKGAQEP